MHPVELIPPILLAFVVSLWLTRRFCDPGSRLHILDHPNERSLHHRPTPRTGGVALLAGLGCGGVLAWVLAGWPAPVAWLAVGAAWLGGVSFLEDRRGVPRRYRLLGHLAAAALVLGAGLAPPELTLGERVWQPDPWLAALGTLLLTTWMINLYNFMDGMDGLAGGMGVIGFTALALAGWHGEDPAFALANALTAAAAAGFLVWNFPPARIFLGDAGSTTLGFLAAGSALWGAREGLLPLWASLLVFSPFLVDASVTLSRRLLRGERIWQAHRTHYYQRLVGLGWSHRDTLLRAYLLMLVCAASALQAPRLEDGQPAWLLAMWAGVYLLIAWKVRLLERRAGTAG